MRYLYLEVTKDDYEFPIYIEDSIKDLAEKSGTNRENVRTSIAHNRKRFKKVLVEEEEHEEIFFKDMSEL